MQKDRNPHHQKARMESEGESSSAKEMSLDEMKESGGGGSSSSGGESEEPGNTEGVWNWVSVGEEEAKEVKETRCMRLP